MSKVVQNSSAGKQRQAAFVPDWLKPELFEDILKTNVTNYQKIIDFKAYDALSAGENYATKILRIQIEVQLIDATTKIQSYIIKLPHFNNLYEDLMKRHNIFHVEAGMFGEYVPEMEQMYKDAGITVKFGAKHYKLNTDENNVLLEDLLPLGFKNANRLECLDMEHAQCVLKKLAQWHAASATRVANKGLYPDKYTKGIFGEESREIIEETGTTMRKPFMQCLKTYKGYEMYGKAMENLSEHFNDVVIKAAKFDPNEFNVLNHGDCWSNNIMFQYDAFGKIKEIYFVDYQIPRYGSPAHDLYYFIMSSTKLEIKLSQFDYMIKFYHDHLIENLTLLKYSKKMPTLKDLHVALIKYSIWGYTTAISILPIVLLDGTDTASFENLVGDDVAGTDFKLLMYANKKFRKQIEVILPWLYNRGTMEF